MIILKDYEATIAFAKQLLTESTKTRQDIANEYDIEDTYINNVLSNTSVKAVPTLQRIMYELGYELKRVRYEHYELRRIEDEQN